MTRTAFPPFAAFALAAAMSVVAPAAQAASDGPVDSFDIDVLTAYRYGLNHDWAPASCFGRRSCPEDTRANRRAEIDRSRR